MTIRKILAPVRGDGNARYVIDHAIAIAKRFNAHVDVAYIQTSLTAPLPFRIPSPLTEAVMDAILHCDSAEISNVLSYFDEVCASEKLVVCSDVATAQRKTSISWSSFTGRQSRMIAKLGRMADMVVVARPDPTSHLGINTLEESLFNTGKAVLIAPKKSVQSLGNHIAIAWSGGVAVSRALTLALPLLRAAQKVSILTVGSNDANREDTTALVDYLRWHGVQAGVRIFDCEQRDLGARLMVEAENSGADLLVMGAYGHNRHKEILMGGVTEHAIWNMNMPIFMAR
ncbi:MAG: nucleotide-binding universal stress UspA family protein [Reinekea sp.]|jgi:nucleotide-binding universal stress UspA family protein